MDSVEWDEQGLKEMQAAIDGATSDITDDIAADARRYAPRDTGRLASTIHVETGDDGARRVVVGSAEADYWAEQEFGTAHQPGTSFMRPALNQQREA